MTAHMILCAANAAARLPNDKAVSRYTLPHHLIAKKMADTESNVNHLYHLAKSILNIKTLSPGYFFRVSWMSLMIVAEVGRDNFQC